MLELTTENRRKKVWVPGLGERLREGRKGTGLSQETAAKKLGISWMTVHRWERDERGVSLENLHKVVDIYSVSILSLVTYTPKCECENSICSHTFYQCQNFASYKDVHFGVPHCEDCVNTGSRGVEHVKSDIFERIVGF